MALTKEDQALSANVGRSGCGFEGLLWVDSGGPGPTPGWGSDGRGAGKGRDAEFCVFAAPATRRRLHQIVSETRRRSDKVSYRNG
jgi:hypothetical protein